MDDALKCQAISLLSSLCFSPSHLHSALFKPQLLVLLFTMRRGFTKGGECLPSAVADRFSTSGNIKEAQLPAAEPEDIEYRFFDIIPRLHGDDS